MSDTPLWLWGLLGGLLVLSGAFSSSETALFSLTPAQRARAGKRVQGLLARPRDLLVVVLVGNLVINVLFFAFVTRLHPAEAEGGAAPGLLVDVGALAALVIFGEILPKTVGLRARVSVARLISGPLVLLAVLLRPLRRVLARALEVASSLASRVVGEERELTPEDLSALLERSAAEGAILDAEADLLAEIVELDDIRVREIMTPRVDAIFLERDGRDREAALARAFEARLAWLPVIEEDPDHVVGRARVRDLVNRPDRDVSELVMPMQFVPEVASALDLLRVLQESRAAEALVIDEWGGTAGVVTIEDVFEEIVGELRTEGEDRERAVIPLGERRYRVPGSLSIRDWNEVFGFHVVPMEFETVGGFVTALLGRIPRTGDVARSGGLVMEVHEARGRRVLAVDIGVDPGGHPGGSAGRGEGRSGNGEDGRREARP